MTVSEKWGQVFRYHMITKDLTPFSCSSSNLPRASRDPSPDFTNVVLRGDNMTCTAHQWVFIFHNRMIGSTGTTGTTALPRWLKHFWSTS